MSLKFEFGEFGQFFKVKNGQNQNLQPLLTCKMAVSAKWFHVKPNVRTQWGNVSEKLCKSMKIMCWKTRNSLSSKKYFVKSTLC